jgi:uncharacterized protein YbjT (DUF2867 family)
MINTSKIPCVAGSTGLVGSFLIKNLSKLYPKVISITRRKFDFQYDNIENIVVDFDKIEEESFLRKIDHLFIALGTTIKKAGSKEKFELVDYHYCYNLAIAAKRLGVQRISIVSSVGSNSQSKLLYPRVKGMIERDLKALNFEHLSIAKPGIILGKRNETRTGEKIGKIIFFLIDKILFGPLKKYKSISADDISKAMIFQIINSKDKLNALHYNELKLSSNRFLVQLNYHN